MTLQHSIKKVMTRKYIPLLCLVSGFGALAVPSFAQSASLRIDTTRSEIRDQYGNVIGSSFEIKVEGNASFEDKMQTIENYKTMFYTREIGLTSSEAERFWPIYNEYFKKMDEIFQKKNTLMKQLFSSERLMETLSDKEVKNLLDAYLSCIEKESALHTEYYKKFLTAMPAKKVARYYQAEQQFKQILLQNLHRRNRY